MNQRRHKHSRQELQYRAIKWRAYWLHDYGPCPYDDDEYDDQWSCTRCGGEGCIESDDPLWDDADEFGLIECWACGGTGAREHQTIF